MKRKIRWENKNFDDMGTLSILLIDWGELEIFMKTLQGA